MSTPSSSATSSQNFGPLAPAEKKKAINYEKYKTELCKKFFSEGWCKYEHNCQFAHGTQELKPLKDLTKKYKNEWCRNVIQGITCPYGSRCHFRHVEDPIDPQSKQPESSRLPHPPSEHPPVRQEGFSFFSTPIEQQW